jgi:RNA polymerase sigma factor (sigma-70 family)
MNPSTNMSDEKLIQFYLNGNPNAMATLVELYKDRIYGSIYTTVQNKFTAEEIFQEVFIRLINNMMAGQMPDDGNFLQWAIKTGHAMCLEYKRKNANAVIMNKTDTNNYVNINKKFNFYK